MEEQLSLKALLEEHRASILERWMGLVLESYPDDAAAFLRKQKDRFANPVGYALGTGLVGLLDGVMAEVGIEELRPRLDDILRIRAVQHLGPTRSLEFIFRLKDAVRAVLGPACREPGVAEELQGLDRKVDALALLGFEVYARCREEIYELRLTELRNRTMDVKEKLLRKRGKWTGPPEEELLLFPDGAPGQPAPLVGLETGGAATGVGGEGAAGGDTSGEG